MKIPIQTIAKVNLARLSFWYFCLWYDEDFFTKRTFLKEIAEGLQKIQTGEIHSISISLPPRAGKSYTVSLFCAWWLGKNQDKCVMRNTVTATLYNKFSYAVRDIVKSEKYKMVFHSAELASDKQNVNCWALKTSTQDAYFGGGVGTNVIGSGANLAITDDLYSGYADATSERYNETLELWKAGSHDSRKEKGCPEIDIGTRWSKGDLIGKGIEEKKYDISIVVPALDANDKSFCEDVKTTEEYLKIRQSIVPELWAGEYMQEPSEVKGLLFNKNDLKRFSMKDFTLEGLESTLGYCDVKDEGDDMLSCPFARIFKNKIFITDVIYSGETIDVTVPICVAKVNEMKVDYLRVEKNNQGGGFIRDLRKEVSPEKILPVTSTQNKLTRIWNEYGFILQNFHFLCEDEIVPGSEYDKFMRNVLGYKKDGTSKHDDGPDSLAGLSKFIQNFLTHLFQ